MEVLIRILIKRLVGRGAEITTIPAYIRDLANTMVVSGYPSLQELNKKMQSLGWDDFELDYYSLQVIIATFEPDLAYKPPHWFDGTFNPPRLSKLADKKDCVPTPQIEGNRPLQE